MDTFSKNSWISSAGLLARFWKVDSSLPVIAKKLIFCTYAQGDGFASNTADLVLDWLSSDPELCKNIRQLCIFGNINVFTDLVAARLKSK